MSAQTELATQNRQVQELVVQAVAAETNLTFIESRHGKDSEEYQSALREFAAAWYVLKQRRNVTEFLETEQVR
jgi:hypothetical protein